MQYGTEAMHYGFHESDYHNATYDVGHHHGSTYPRQAVYDQGMPTYYYGVPPPPPVAVQGSYYACMSASPYQSHPGSPTLPSPPFAGGPPPFAGPAHQMPPPPGHAPASGMYSVSDGFGGMHTSPDGSYNAGHGHQQQFYPPNAHVSHLSPPHMQPPHGGMGGATSPHMHQMQPPPHYPMHQQSWLGIAQPPPPAAGVYSHLYLQPQHAHAAHATMGAPLPADPSARASMHAGGGVCPGAAAAALAAAAASGGGGQYVGRVTSTSPTSRARRSNQTRSSQRNGLLSDSAPTGAPNGAKGAASQPKTPAAAAARPPPPPYNFAANAIPMEFQKLGNRLVEKVRVLDHRLCDRLTLHLVRTESAESLEDLIAEDGLLKRKIAQVMVEYLRSIGPNDDEQLKAPVTSVVTSLDGSTLVTMVDGAASGKPGTTHNPAGWLNISPSITDVPRLVNGEHTEVQRKKTRRGGVAHRQREEAKAARCAAREASLREQESAQAEFSSMQNAWEGQIKHVHNQGAKRGAEAAGTPSTTTAGASPYDPSGGNVDRDTDRDTEDDATEEQVAATKVAEAIEAAANVEEGQSPKAEVDDLDVDLEDYLQDMRDEEVEEALIQAAAVQTALSLSALSLSDDASAAVQTGAPSPALPTAMSACPSQWLDGGMGCCTDRGREQDDEEKENMSCSPQRTAPQSSGCQSSPSVPVQSV